jgi:hypothetical protein
MALTMMITAVFEQCVVRACSSEMSVDTYSTT